MVAGPFEIDFCFLLLQQQGVSRKKINDDISILKIWPSTNWTSFCFESPCREEKRDFVFGMKNLVRFFLMPSIVSTFWQVASSPASSKTSLGVDVSLLRRRRCCSLMRARGGCLELKIKLELLLASGLPYKKIEVFLNFFNMAQSLYFWSEVTIGTINYNLPHYTLIKYQPRLNRHTYR